MKTRTFKSLVRDVLFGTVLTTTLVASDARGQTAAEAVASNKAIIERSFQAWAAGTGGPYDLLREDARWEITGRSAASKVYPSRAAFLSEVIRPFNARMKERLKPTIRGIHADGNTVIVLFDAAGVARDGKPYTNTYSWYLHLENGEITSATAFFDSIAFNDLWSRVAPE